MGLQLYWCGAFYMTSMLPDIICGAFCGVFYVARPGVIKILSPLTSSLCVFGGGSGVVILFG